MPAWRASATWRSGAVAAAVLALATLRVGVGDTATGLGLDVLLAFCAAAGTLEAARRARRLRSRAAWYLQTAGVAAWLIAPLAWLTPLPDDVASAGRLAFVVCAGAAWWLTSHWSDPWSRVRLVIDSCLAGGSVFVVTWLPVFETVTERHEHTAVAVVAAVVPLAALAVATVAAGVALTEMRPEHWLMPGLFIVAMLVLAASDVAYGVGGTPIWAVGWAFYALGTRAYGGTSARRDVVSTHGALVHAPYVLLAPAVVVLVTQHLNGGIPPAEISATVAMAVLLLARQQITLLENRGLVDRLAATQDQLRHQATHDALTGLAGRVLLHEHLAAAVAQRSRHPAAGPDAGAPMGLAVVFVDLDDFKDVNDTLGHAAGDDVLVQTAQRLTGVLAPLGDAARAFRMSGDEFAVLLTGPVAQDAAEVAGRMLAALCEPVVVGGRTVAVGGSIGVAVAADDDVTIGPMALLRAADLAMYDVKHHGKSGVRLAPAVTAGDAVG